MTLPWQQKEIVQIVELQKSDHATPLFRPAGNTPLFSSEMLLDKPQISAYTLFMPPRIPTLPPLAGDTTLEACACATLRETSRTLTRRYDEALKPSGLLATQYIVLVAIQKEQPATISQLAEMLAMDRTTLTRNLKPLETSGLIVSGKGDDQRQHVVSLTLKGKAAMEKAFPLWHKAQTHIAATLGITRFKRLLADLKEVVALFR